MKIYSSLAYSLAIMALFVLSAVQPAQARTNVGTLSCETTGGVAFIVGTPRDLHCVFYKTNGQSEAYAGSMGEVGFDFGISARGVISWSVITPSANVAPGDLAGRFAGSEAGGALLAGAHARTLVGGRHGGVLLEPLETGSDSGLNIAFGATFIDLHPLFTVSQSAAPLVPAVGHSHDTVPAAQLSTHYGCGSYTHLTSGQTLSGLARACGVSLEALLDANPQITNVREISVGALVNLPSHVFAQGESPCGDRAIIEQDEALEHVAWRCGVTLHALLLENGDLRDMSDVRPGRVLKIPLRASSPASTPLPPVTIARTANQGDALQLPELVPSNDQTLALLARLCVSEASSRFGIAGNQITSGTASRVNNDTFAVNLDIGGGNTICLVRSDGTVLDLARPVQLPPVSLPNPSPTFDITTPLDDEETVVRIGLGASGFYSTDGSISGRQSNVYLLDAEQSGPVRFSLQTGNSSTYFNLYDADDGSGAALYNASTDGEMSAVVNLEAGRRYLVRPYLFGPAADNGERSTYTLNIEVVRDAGASPQQPAQQPTASAFSLQDFDASGTADCSANQPTLDQQCEFRVKRGEPAYVELARPQGGYRMLTFVDGDITTQEGDLSWGFDGDIYSVGIDLNEFYSLPVEIIVGG